MPLKNRPSFIAALKDAEREYFEIRCESGRNPLAPNDRGHFAVKGSNRPLSVSPLEAKLLFNLVSLTRSQNVIEVGTGFGYSASWMAAGFFCEIENPRLFTVDNWSEGPECEQHAAIAQRLWRKLGVSDQIVSVSGTSPQIFSDYSFPNMDLAFIDGEHRNGQPLLDYRCVEKLMRPRGIIVFHDVQAKYEVQEAVEAAIQDGFKIVRVNSSCEPCVAFRDHEQREEILTSLFLAERGEIVIPIGRQ